jgi:hypothetical protein
MNFFERQAARAAQLITSGAAVRTCSGGMVLAVDLAV